MMQRLESILRAYDPQVVARGKLYAAEGRVVELRHDRGDVHAVVRGTKRYEVTVSNVATGDYLLTDCSCLAYEREAQCKHLAAVFLTLQRTRGAAVPHGGPRAEQLLPRMLHGVHSASAFLAHLSLYAGERIGEGVERWSPLVDWWAHAGRFETPRTDALRAHVLAHAPAIAREVASLHAWTPPEAPLPGTSFGDLFVTLAEHYVTHRARAQLRSAPPGPLDGRHPGFVFHYDPRRGLFQAGERPTPLLASPRRFAFLLPPLTPAEPRFEGDEFSSHLGPDVWDLFALRAVLIALHARTEDAVVALEGELGRPAWDQVLEHLTARATPRAPLARDWAFCLIPTYDGGYYKITAYARRAGTEAKRGKWKKQPFEALYAEEATPVEREIARVALCCTVRSAEAGFTLGTPQAHELLRVLAQHPRTHLARGNKPDPEQDPVVEIVVGELTMRLAPGPEGTLSPRFMLGEKEVSAHLLGGLGAAPFRGGAREGMIASAFVPAALKPWLAASEKLGAALRFPPEAVPKLASTTQALVSSGFATLPREALGAELVYAPAPALRIEWHRDGGALVTVFVGVHPSAPLVAAGMGPALFTFEHEGERVFVERDLARETALAVEARGLVEAPILWDHMTGRTEGLQDALALAAFLDHNPRGLRIEVMVGRAPSVMSWDEATRDLHVSKDGAWLVLDGTIDLGSAKLTLGDVLDAARLAGRYVKAADGVFLELSKEAIDKLRPVAMATELAETRGDPRLRIHDAFGPLLAEASDVFGSVGGADLAEYARRFEARDRRVRVPSLEHGVLRPYQREGVAWMLRLASWAPGCVLADDMGLGKTVQTAAVLKARAKLGPQLIIAPASVSSNWMSELARFMPSLRCRWLNDGRETVPAELAAGDVLVVSYGLLQRRSELFAGTRWATVVIDEAQYVKNVTAARTDAVRTLQRDFTIALTGTPLENHLGELFSIADLVFPGLLGSEPTFREKFRRPIEGHRDAVRLGVLARLLAPFLLRRTRRSVLEDLPPREEITEYIDLSPLEAKRYLALRRVCEQQFAKRKKEETAAQLKIALLAALTRLRQLACDVRLVDPTYEGPSTKIARTVELAVELAEEGNRALVFSQFTQFLEKVRDALVAAGLRVAYLSGDTPTLKRRAIVEAFQAGEYDVFCVSLLAGGTGLNLTRASYVIHTDPWWNPAAEEQATSRAHRMGQTDPVTVYRLVARGTIEEAVLAMHAAKKNLASAVLEGKANAKAITSTELLDLLRFGG